MTNTIDLTIVMPCLNEAETLGGCIEKARLGIERSGVRGDILVADNGSHDDSVQIGGETRSARCSYEGEGIRQRIAGRHSSRVREMDCHGDAGQSYDFLETDRFVKKFIDVLHRASQPMMLCLEAVRIGREAIVLKDHLAQGSLDYLTLQIMEWVGNALALPYNYWSLTKARRAFDKVGLRIKFWESNLKLYPLPADLVLGRSLHFIALLGMPSENEVHIEHDKIQAKRAS